VGPAAGAVDGPSVLQLRSQDLASDDAVSIVANALEAHREDIAGGALLSIDEAVTRVRMLPLRGSQETLVVAGAGPFISLFWWLGTK
jgi:hypothetical protein